MRVVLGRTGILETLGGHRLRELRPDWSFAEAHAPEWAELLRDADVAIPIVSAVTDAELDGSSVRFVQQFGVGLDTVDLAACLRRGIPVANVPGDVSGNAESVAELALSMVLALVRDLDAQRASLLAGRGGMPTRALFGQHVVLVGLGAIGRAVALRLAPFGVRISAVRTHPEAGGAPGVDAVHGPAELDAVLSSADVVICCAPDSGSGPLFTAARFGAMPQGALFVNVARGGLVDEPALLAALDSGAVSAAGLDVFAVEPIDPANPLVTHPRVLATPHIGGVTNQNLLGTAEAVVDNIERFLAGAPIRWQSR